MLDKDLLSKLSLITTMLKKLGIFFESEGVMMNKTIDISIGKTLKLSNALIRCIAEDEFPDYEKIVEMMGGYIKSKGSQPVGPLIQRTRVAVDEEGIPILQNCIILQSSNYIHNVESPYTMEAILRVQNCIYTRFIGEEDKIKYAYDKMSVYAYENGIGLSGTTYAVFIDATDENQTTDIFLECEPND